MANPNASFYAALDAEIYNVNAADNPLTLTTINKTNGQSYQSVSNLTDGLQAPFVVPSELAQVTPPDGPSAGVTFFYGADGFVGQVFQDASSGQFVVAFRGTDSAASIVSSAAGAFIGLSTSSVDAQDGITNGLLSGGTLSKTTISTSNGSFNAPGQLADALALTNAVIAAAGGSSNVTVTGQSLGGGLAGLVSAYLNVRSYIFDAAPFDNQITLQSYIDAKNILQNTAAFANVSIAIHSGGPTAAPSVTIPSQALTQVFIDEADAIYDTYEQTLAQNATSIRIKGEFLSNNHNIAGFGIDFGSATFFDMDAQAIAAGATSWDPDMGRGAVILDAGLGDYTELHSPSLIALVLNTEIPNIPFSTIVKNDISLAYAFYGSPTINGTADPVASSVSHSRADPTTATPVGSTTSFNNTSSIQASGTSASILERALLETSALYTSFSSQFGALIDSGAAAEGLSGSNFKTTQFTPVLWTSVSRSFAIKSLV